MGDFSVTLACDEGKGSLTGWVGSVYREEKRIFFLNIKYVSVLKLTLAEPG